MMEIGVACCLATTNVTKANLAGWFKMAIMVTGMCRAIPKRIYYLAGRIAQTVTRLAANLLGSGVRSHSFIEIGHEIISTVFLFISADLRWVV